jgi:excisionase family DNA binding protein
MPIPATQVSSLPFADDRVVSIAEAARLSNLSVPTLRRCNRRGELRIIKLSPRRVGVRLSDLKSWLDSRAV